MPKIRQEINILVGELVAASGSAGSSDALIKVDTTKYTGATYYFEIVAYSDVSLAFDVSITNTLSNNLATINVPTLTTAPTLFRSSSFSPTTDDLHVTISNAVGTNKRVKSARVVILQDTSAILGTETQIEIGSVSTSTSTTDVPLTNSKYWQYNASNFDGNKTFYFEGVFSTRTTKSAAAMKLQTSTSITAPSWSDVASSEITTTTFAEVRVRSGAISLVDGNWYRAVMRAGNSKSGIDVDNAKVIITQLDGAYLPGNLGAVSVQGGTAGSGQSFQAKAGAFKLNATSTITAVKVKLLKVASPTDTINFDITSSLGGSSLANGTIAASSLTTSAVEYTITFASPVILTGGTQYYLQITRSPDTNDTTNYIQVSNNADGVTVTDHGAATRANNSWGSANEATIYFSLVGAIGIKKIETQYLLANALFAAGTALQTFLTKWDSAEWDAVSGTINYYFQSEAANDSTSDVTLEQADGGGTVTNSTVTNIDNAQVSSAMTMPGNENLDTKATTNAGDVAGARILVFYVFTPASAGFIAQKPVIVNQAINRAGTY